MEIRKTIKVFLASSEELKEEREKFGNFIRRLDGIFLHRGIHVELLMWEDMDPCYNNVRKQDEYNAWIRQSFRCSARSFWSWSFWSKSFFTCQNPPLYNKYSIYI